MAGEEFPIVVAIKPDVTAGEQVVDKSLAQLETHAKSTGDAIGKAIGGGFADAAVKVKAGDAAARAFATSTLAASKAVADETDRLRGLATAFAQLERATLPTVRAEREYADAVKLANEAVKAGVATEQQAAAVLASKAKALDSAKLSAEGYDKAMASTSAQAPKTGASLLGFVDVVGKVGAAMGTVNTAIAAGRAAIEAYGRAAKVARQAWADMTLAAPTNSQALVNARQGLWDAAGMGGSAEAFADATSLTGSVDDTKAKIAAIQAARAKAQATLQVQIDTGAAADARTNYNNAVEAALDEADRIQLALSQQVVAEAKAGGVLTRDMQRARSRLDGQVAAINAKLDALEASPLARGDDRLGFRMDRGSAEAARSKAVRDSAAAAADALVAAQAEIERTSPWNELAADIAIVTGRLTEANAAALEWAKANEDTYEASPWDDLAGDIATAYSAVRDLADGLDTSATKLDEAKDAVNVFDDAVAKAAAGSVADLVDVMAKMTAEWDFSADALVAWGETALRTISEVILKRAALALVQQIFGRFGGGNANGFGSLLFQALGGSRPSGSSARLASPGDPFGGAGGNAPTAIMREPVRSPGTSGDGNASSTGQAVNLKVVVVSNERDAAKELLDGPEGERAVLAHTAKHRGKLGALR